MTGYVMKTGAAEGCQQFGQSRDFVRALFALEHSQLDCRFNASRGEGFWVSRTEKITGLDGAEEQVLFDWLSRAESGCIDAVVDLALRPWKVEGPRAIVGVFEKQRDQASWLIVRYRSGFVLINCADGFVSDVSAALPDILTLIDAFDINLT